MWNQTPAQCIEASLASGRVESYYQNVVRGSNIVANREIPLRRNWNSVDPAQLFFSGSSTITAAHWQEVQRFRWFSRFVSSSLTFSISWASSFSDGKTVMYSLARTLLARPSSA